MSHIHVLSVPRRLAQPGLTDFPYASFGNLQLLLRADRGVYTDAGVTPAADGQTVQQWNDFSGAQRNFSQATAGLRPTFRLNPTGFNGRSAIEFDTTDDQLTGPGTLDTYIAAGAVTVLVAMRVLTTALSRFAFKDSGSFFETGWGATQTALTRNWDGTQDAASVTIADNATFILEHWHTGGNISVRANGGAANTVASGDTTNLTGTPWIGTNLNGSIAELAVYDADIGDANRTTWRNYANAKYAAF